MRIPDKLRSRWAAFTHDLLAVPVAWLGAYWLRFNLEVIPEPYLLRGLQLLPLIVAVQGAAFWYFGLYRGVWRFASIPDLVRILKSIVVGVSVTAALSFLIIRMQDVPRSVFPLYSLLVALLVGGPRLIYRWTKDHRLNLMPAKAVMIVGAGTSGEMLARDLMRNPEMGYRPVAFVDDDGTKQRREVHGIPVVGSCSQLPELAKRLRVDLILIAMPSATSKQMRRVVELCEKTDVPFRTVPHLQDLVSGRVTVNELREVSIEDLLGREPVKLDWDSIRGNIEGKSVVVTGGGGSIGSELCRQIAGLSPQRLVVFENSEFNLYSVERELRTRWPGLAVDACLGDVRDLAAVERVFSVTPPDIVFHAAAYKHVPMLQFHVREAARTNILGTANVARMAARHGCDAFVLISTDKAVHPTNVMGATKRAAEMVCQSLAEASTTRYITVRFGNVLGSAGSVVPLFREQIASGGPLTVTHPEVKRYFMTIPEACQLILQAGVLGTGGEIFVLDMGEPVNIQYLAKQMIILSGKKPGEDIEIVYTGLRPGEKMFEELFHEDEPLAATTHAKILLAGYRPVDQSAVSETLARLDEACATFDEKLVRQLLSSLVPESREALGGREKQQDNVIPLERVTR